MSRLELETLDRDALIERLVLAEQRCDVGARLIAELIVFLSTAHNDIAQAVNRFGNTLRTVLPAAHTIMHMVEGKEPMRGVEAEELPDALGMPNTRGN